MSSNSEYEQQRSFKGKAPEYQLMTWDELEAQYIKIKAAAKKIYKLPDNKQE